MPPVLSKIERQFEFYAKDHSGELGQKLNRARKEKRFCDFCIKIGSEEIHVHKNVIAEVSDYFREMFAHKMEESKSGVAEMHDIDAYCMLICIEYIYTGKVSVPGSKVTQLLKVADMLQLPKLCAAIADFLESNLDANTFFVTREIATTHCLKDLMKSCDEFAEANFASIIEKEDFKNLEGVAVLKMIGSKDTKASEAEKCRSLVVWANSDPDNRSQTFEDAFLTLKMSEIPESYKLHLSENESLVSESNRCVRQLFKSEMGGVSAKDFKSSDNTVIGVIDLISKTIQTFNPRDKSWNALHNITEEISKKYFCAIAVDQVIFVLADDCSNYKFNLLKPTEGWIELPRRSESDNVQVVEINGQLYVFYGEDETSTTIEILDTDHTSWRRIEKPKPCCWEAITVAKGRIFTFGGDDGSVLQRSTKFDPNTNSWTNLPDMPTARCAAAATALDNRIYVVGGYNAMSQLKTTECFDIATQKWTILKPMNNPRWLFNAFPFDDKIYALESLTDPFVVEEYDPATDIWKDVIEVSAKDIPSYGTFTIRI